MRLLIQILASAFGTLSFVALFSVPKKYYWNCAFIGACAWIVYYILWEYKLVRTEPVAIFFGTVIGILLARLFAVRERCPVTIFLVSAILPLVPGAGIYWTAFYLVTNQLDLAGSRGFLAIKIALAIVLGIVLVFEIPQNFFAKMINLFPPKKEQKDGSNEL